MSFLVGSHLYILPFAFAHPRDFLLSFFLPLPFAFTVTFIFTVSSSNPCSSPVTRMALLFGGLPDHVFARLLRRDLPASCASLVLSWLFVLRTLLAVFPVSFWLCLIILLWIPTALPTCYTLGFLLYFVICLACIHRSVIL